MTKEVARSDAAVNPREFHPRRSAAFGIESNVRLGDGGCARASEPCERLPSRPAVAMRLVRRGIVSVRGLDSYVLASSAQSTVVEARPASAQDRQPDRRGSPLLWRDLADGPRD